jgi:MOSC domain-containing protein YiiM
MGSTGGTLAGIARRAAPRAPMEVLDAADLSVEAGVGGDFRGRLKPGARNRRQVSLIERSDWDAATAEIGAALPWQTRRANLLVEGLDLPQQGGARLRIGATALVEITVECDPCFRMEQIAPGLEAALTPDWRGGALARVLEGGRIAVGDTIRIEEA